MTRQNLSVTALAKELTKLSAVAALTATTTLFVGTYNLQDSTDHAIETVEQFENETAAAEPGAMPAMQDPFKDQPDLDNLGLAPAQSMRPQARPTSDSEATTEASDILVAQVEMANHNAIRNLPITESLKENISSAVGAVYGPGFKLQVYSGGQHNHETAACLGVRRVGTKAHDNGHAADIYVIDPQGQRITGNALAPLAQYWLATGKGGVGLEMKGGGIHLDEGRVRFWDYSSDGGSVTKVQLAALIAGKRGVMPKLHNVAKSANAAVLDQETSEPIQRVASATGPNSYGVTLGATKLADGPIKIHGQYTLVNHRHWEAMLKTEYDTADKDGQVIGYVEYNRKNLSATISAAQDEKPEFAIQWSWGHNF